jgi:hypothetical protein
VQREAYEPYHSDQFFTRLSNLAICSPSNHPPSPLVASFAVSVSDAASFHMDNVSFGCLGMQITRSYGIKVRDCEFRFVEGTAIHATSCNEAHRGGIINILDSHFVECGTGVLAELCDQLVVRGNAFSKTTSDAIKVVGHEGDCCIDVAVESNTITDSSGTAVHLEFLNKFTAKGNRISKCDGNGIKASNCLFGVIDGNLLSNVALTVPTPAAAIDLEVCNVVAVNSNVIGNEASVSPLDNGVRAVVGNDTISAVGNLTSNVGIGSDVVVVVAMGMVASNCAQPVRAAARPQSWSAPGHICLLSQLCAGCGWGLAECPSWNPCAAGQPTLECGE